VPSAWQQIDWDAPRPDDAGIRSSRDRLSYAPVPASGPATSAYLAAVASTHANGGALLARFHVTSDDETFRWFSSRNRYDEYGFWSHALGARVVREALPQLRIPDPLPDLEFKESWAGTLTLDGELAATLVRGGAYMGFGGTSSEAKQLAAACATELFGERHEDYHSYRSHAAWTPWFFDVAWDATWLIIDDRDATITLLCVTDTD
jgi:hypothetical protein